jgi:hypothetical protein
VPDTYYLYGDAVTQTWKYVEGAETCIRDDLVHFHVVIVPEADPIAQAQTYADCLAPLNATADERAASMNLRIELRAQIDQLNADLPQGGASGPPPGWVPPEPEIPTAPPPPYPTPEPPPVEQIPEYPADPDAIPPSHLTPPDIIYEPPAGLDPPPGSPPTGSEA